MADLKKKRKNITSKKETLARKKHNSEDRAEVIIVSDNETEVNVSTCKRRLCLKIIAIRRVRRTRRDHYRINNSRHIIIFLCFERS